MDKLQPISKLKDVKEDSFARAMYFPTMIFSVSCARAEELNPYLLTQIYAERDRDQRGIKKSNYPELGGWHSRSDLHKESTFIPIVESINQAARRISDNLGYHLDKHLKIGSMWSIINPPGSNNRQHIHPQCHWSGVYYVHAPEQAGNIEFIDPRTAQVMNMPSFRMDRKRGRENWTKVQFQPTPGKMLIFPSWLYHSVAPNLCQKTGQQGDRVIISFNLKQVNR